MELSLAHLVGERSDEQVCCSLYCTAENLVGIKLNLMVWWSTFTTAKLMLKGLMGEFLTLLEIM
jgi:hypothetical protein